MVSAAGTRRVRPPPLYGLVLAGGAGRRMRGVKAWLRYDGLPQWARARAVLRAFCRVVCVSVRSPARFRAGGTMPPGAPPRLIRDRHRLPGPMNGLLSAMSRHPRAAWLVLACDLPRMDRATLARLVRHRDPARVATVFCHPRGPFLEPLCAIYEPAFRAVLLEHARAACYSLNRLLAQSPVRRVRAPGPGPFRNVNTPADYRAARPPAAGEAR